MRLPRSDGAVEHQIPRGREVSTGLQVGPGEGRRQVHPASVVAVQDLEDGEPGAIQQPGAALGLPVGQLRFQHRDQERFLAGFGGLAERDGLLAQGQPAAGGGDALAAGQPLGGRHEHYVTPRVSRVS